MSSTRKGALFALGKADYAIPEAERDRNLFMAGEWPQAAAAALAGRWDLRDGHLFRLLNVFNEQEDEEEARPRQLWEALLRFPNAPLYATHKKRVPPFVFEDSASWPNFHTMRVFGSGSEPPEQVKHVFLLHNGLNETADLTFHYRLAAWILAGRTDAVCILRPLPGHLTRFAFHGPYAELPLDVYLRDPAELFRQFLRHMLETQWLLSALVPRPHYAVMGGTELLAEVAPRGARPERRGRTDAHDLADEMAREWQTAFDRTEEAAREGLTPSTAHHKGVATPSTLEAAVEELRRLIGWRSVVTTSPPPGGGPDGPAEPEAPCIHMVGYSMGGFMAQAAFFAWPFAISSCTNMFAGGALRDLAPTAFADPEEWQAVLHGMRYELDVAFRDYLRPVRGRIAGVRERDFGYFTRIFYEVYLQYYRGGYRSRVSEFSRRLLFVVGGDDPIVRTKNVLDAGPPQGMTLFQIADVSHFPAGRGRGPDGGKLESEQRRYWLPEVGRVIANFADHSASLLSDTLAASWGAAQGTGRAPASEAAPLKPLDQAPVLLESTSFARELRRLVQRIEPDAGAARPAKGEAESLGWLLVSRNEVPPVFIGTTGYRFHGQAMHHSEQQIADYVRMMRERARYLRRRHARATLLIPAHGDRWFWNQKFFSMSETPSAAREPRQAEKATMTRSFQRWVDAGVVRDVTAGEYGRDGATLSLGRLGELGEVVAERHGTERLSLTILPDVWICISPNALGRLSGEVGGDARSENEAAIVRWATRLARGGEGEQRKLQERIDAGEVLAISVSAAEINPRYRGRRMLSAKHVGAAIIHWALTYQASEPARSAPPIETEQLGHRDAAEEPEGKVGVASR